MIRINLGRKQRVSKQDVENIWTKEGWSDERVEKAA
jgi:hypothetical protein